MKDQLDFLKKTDLLSNVPERLLPEIAASFQVVGYAPGFTIFSEGDPGDALYLVREGLVRVERDSIPVAVRKPGDCVGEMALLDQSPRSSTLVAQTALVLLRLSAEDFKRLIALNPEISTGIHRVLTSKLRESIPESAESTLRLTSVVRPQTGPGLLMPKDLTGTTFAGRYQMQELLGKGGMAYVYRAEDVMLGIPVAMKILHRISEESILARFKQEVVLARKVVHPGVCRIFDFGEGGGLYYVSMELIEGESLGDKMAEKLTMNEAFPILRQVLEALGAVHELGIIHRDIKPQNIMIDLTGRALIMDFGVAFFAEASARLTQEGQFVGTLHYMAPEQFDGVMDHRSDLYAMGVVLYEMFTGRRPFPSGTTAAMVHAHLYIDPPRPQDIAPDISPRLQKIILKALEKDPENRYQSAARLLEDLTYLVG